MLLIRNGLIHTMTDEGSYKGDILIQAGKILRVERHMHTEGLQLQRTIDAEGLQICPGLIDAHMHLVQFSDDMQRNISMLCADALSSGVTTQAIWPEGHGSCIIRHGMDDAVIGEPMHSIQAEDMTDAQLREAMLEARTRGERIACEVCNARMLSRLLHAKQATGAQLVLAHLTGCDDMLDEVIESGCEVILGACVLRSGNGGYAMAAKLSQAGVTVALTSDYPATRLHHLPLCTGLGVRAGMEYQAALRAITLDAARLLQVDDVCGSIEPGKRADMVLFDGDPLLLATARIMTVSGGQIVQEN